MRVLSPVFRKKKGDQNTLLTAAVFQVPLAQNDSCTEVAYFGVAYSATFHHISPPPPPPTHIFFLNSFLSP